jgi:phosphoglycerate kinase
MLRTLRNASSAALRGTALVWIDLNTADNARAIAAEPTIRRLRADAEKIVLISHRGRPNPARPDPKLSLRRDARMLSRLYRTKVIFVPGTDSAVIRKVIEYAPPKSVLLLENIRFFKGEKEQSKRFAQQLASLGTYFVNEAFSVSHHGSASMSVLPRLMPAYAGYDLEHEVEALSRVMHRPRHPVVLIVGGAKAEDKLGVLNAYAHRADIILVGGASANTLLYLRGEDIGSSVRERDPKLLKAFTKILKFPNLLLPIDVARSHGKILDIGPHTIKQFVTVIESARTILWAGPLGMIEKKAFSTGTLAIARAIAKNKKAFSVTGGGETTTFLHQHKLEKKFSLVSTGGGAMIEFLAGKKLPGIQALQKK